MKKANEGQPSDEMRAEYDFSKGCEHPSSAFGTFSPRGGEKDLEARETLLPRTGGEGAEGG